MSLIGQILKYLLVIVIILFAICIILAGAMVMIPSFSLFGIHYLGEGGLYKYQIENTQATETEPATYGYTEFVDSEALQINTEGYDVYIRTLVKNETAMENAIRINVSNYLTGFAWGDVERPQTTWGSKFINGVKTYVITVEEPTGWLYHSKTFVELIVNSNDLVSKNLEINTNGGSVYLGVGDTTGEDGSVLNLKNLTLNGAGNECFLNYINVNEKIDINKTAGNIKSLLDINCPTEIDVWGGIGKIEIPNIGNKDSNQTLKIKATNSEIRFNDLYGDFELVAQGGYLVANEISRSVNINCESCQIKIAKVGTQLNISVNSDSSSSANSIVNIGYIGDNAYVKGGDSTVKLGEVIGKVSVETNKGKIIVENARKSVYAKSIYGEVNINWVDNLIYNSENASDFETVVEVKYSSVNITNIIGKLTMNIIDSGNAKINAEFNAVNGKSVINTNAGDITLSLPLKEYVLKWNSNRNSDISLGSIVTNDKVGVANILSASSEENSVQASSINGLITIRQNFV